MNSKHITLVVNTIARVQLTAVHPAAFSGVDVVTRSGATDVFFTVIGWGDTTGVEPVDPVSGADDTYVLPPSAASPASMRRLRFNSCKIVVVKLLSAGAEKVSLIGYSRGEDAGTW